MKKICSLLVLCATVVFASCSKDDPVTEPVPEGITVTTYDALLDALQTGGTSADAPTLVTLGGNITIPAGGDYTTPPMNGSGHFKIDGGGHTMTWEDGNNYHFLGNFSPDADAVYIELTNINLVQQDIKSAVCYQRQDYAGQRRGIDNEWAIWRHDCGCRRESGIGTG